MVDSVSDTVMESIADNQTILTGIASTKPGNPNEFICFLLAFSFGVLTAFIAKTISAPIERIKLIQQTLSKESFTHIGIISCAKYIYSHEGILAYWRGNLANCLRYVPRFALDMAIKEPLGRLIYSGETVIIVIATKWAAGAIASFCSTIICYPLEFIRTRLATDIGR